MRSHQNSEDSETGERFSPSETAHYTAQTLWSLREIARRQRQTLLAFLLQAAAEEAECLAAGDSPHLRET